jgi:pilus assembly protein CpaE
MAAEPIRVGIAGTGPQANDVVASLERAGTFRLANLAGGGKEGGPDVVVLVDSSDAEPREQLAAAREHTAAPIVFATSKTSSDLARWVVDAGIADVLPLPASDAHTAFAVEKAACAAQHVRGARGGRVITVFSPKGGSGKSVVTTNLAVAAATFSESRTLLVDLDLQFGDAAIMLGLSPSSTVRELIGSPTQLDAEKLDVYTERHSSGVAVLPAPMNPEDAELVGEEAVQTILTVARDSHDLVVVDTAPFFYGPMLATLDQTDELLVLCNPDLPTLKNVRLTLKTLELLSFPEERIKIVLNRASSASGMERGDVAAALDRPVDFVLPLDPTVPLAVNVARPSVLANPDSPFTAALLDLARTVTAGDRAWIAASKPSPARVASRLLSFGRS